MGKFVKKCKKFSKKVIKKKNVKLYKKIRKNYRNLREVYRIGQNEGKEEMLYTIKADLTYALYDKRKIKRLKKFPPKMVENRILFETNDDFTDNGRAIFDYMIENGFNKKYELVWLVHDPSKYKKYEQENVKFIQNFKKHSTIRRAEAYRYALTSKFIFYTQAFNWIGMSRK